VLLAVFVVLYVANGAVIGWKTAYDVMIGITSPGDESVSAPPLAWFMSVAGWLAAPAVSGAVAGVVIGVAVDSRRHRPISEVLTRHNEPVR
jgi:hypothetical protein